MLGKQWETLRLEEKIGNFSHCSYSVNGVGRYKPMERANPFIGKVGKFGKVEEERVECVCNKGRAKEVVAAMRKVTHTKK